MYTITKCFEFEASHKLVLTYDSPCTNLHGHSYKVRITVKGDNLDENGMITDFSNLKPVKDWVMDNWDHATIVPENRVDPNMEAACGKIHKFPHHNVTAEFMCMFLHGKACDILGLSGSMIEIRINETANNYATYSE